VSVTGNKMSSSVVCKMALFIKGKKFTHHVNVIDQVNYNIIGIELMHIH